MAWPELLGTAVHALKLSPSEFWRMTFVEFRAVADAFTASPDKLSRTDLEELDRIGKAAMEQEASHVE